MVKVPENIKAAFTAQRVIPMATVNGGESLTSSTSVSGGGRTKRLSAW